MKTQYPTLVTEQSVIVLVKGKPLTANRNHPMFDEIMNRVRSQNYMGIEKLFDLRKTVEKCFNVEIRNNCEVFYKGKKINNILTDKIIGALRSGIPYKPYIKFLNNLMDNPSEYCREQLFSYVEHYGLPIDSNGFVYSWKAVNSKFRDKYTNTKDYSPGKTVVEDRDKCKTAETEACGFGLHCGATSYVLDFLAMVMTSFCWSSSIQKM